jgi:hypothetical protein
MGGGQPAPTAVGELPPPRKQASARKAATTAQAGTSMEGGYCHRLGRPPLPPCGACISSGRLPPMRGTIEHTTATETAGARACITAGGHRHWVHRIGEAAAAVHRIWEAAAARSSSCMAIQPLPPSAPHLGGRCRPVKLFHGDTDKIVLLGKLLN